MLRDDDHRSPGSRQDDDKKKYDDDDDRKVDWRELDRRRDRSQHRGSADTSNQPQQRPSRQQEYQVERYKKQLEELFKGPKPNPEQEKLLKKIRQARGAEIDKLCRDYQQQHGFPKDWESLMQFLDCSSADLLTPVLTEMEKLSLQENASRQNLFKQRLRLLQMTTADKIVRKQAEAILGKLP